MVVADAVDVFGVGVVAVVVEVFLMALTEDTKRKKGINGTQCRNVSLLCQN